MQLLPQCTSAEVIAKDVDEKGKLVDINMGLRNRFPFSIKGGMGAAF